MWFILIPDTFGGPEGFVNVRGGCFEVVGRFLEVVGREQLIKKQWANINHLFQQKQTGVLFLIGIPRNSYEFLSCCLRGCCLFTDQGVFVFLVPSLP